MSAILQVDDLYFHYGDHCAVDGLSLELGAGKLTSLLGPNGAGKTTTVKMLTGDLPWRQGSLRFDGAACRSNDPAYLRQLGVVDQDLSVWEHLTAWECGLFVADLYEIPRAEAKDRWRSLLERVELWERRKERPINFSGGMRRRLHVAQGLITRPKLVFLDEPTPGMDPQSRRMLWNFVRSLVKEDGCSILMTTHFMDEADQLSDYIYIVDHGKIIAEGTADALKKTHGEGDILEITLDKKHETALKQWGEKHEGRRYLAEREVGESEICVIFQGLHLEEQLPDLFSFCSTVGFTPRISLRPNSLEDVFLALTGTYPREE